MQTFEEQIREEIQGYQGPHQDLIACAPLVYRLLARLIDDPDLPGRLRPLVLVTIAYFMLPVDTISEDLTGPRGYLDDLFLSALISDILRREMGSGELLERSWEGEGPFLSLADAILQQEKDLIGDQRDVILWYIGFEHLVKNLA